LPNQDEIGNFFIEDLTSIIPAKYWFKRLCGYKEEN